MPKVPLFSGKGSDTDTNAIKQDKNALERVAGTISQIFLKLERQGSSIILQSLSSPLTEAKKNEVLQKIRDEVGKADREFKPILVDAVTRSYVIGMNQTVAMLKKAKMTAVERAKLKGELENITPTSLQSEPVMAEHRKVVNNMLSDAYLDFGSSMTSYIRGVEKIMNDALKQQIRSSIAKGQLEGESIQQIKGTIKDQFTKDGFTVLFDKGGRRWTVSNYSEMLTRTHVIRTANEGTINRASDFGVDIVEVSDHNADDRLCADEEGKIYSISGTSENYPPLAGHEPPYHPNCSHNLLMRPDLE